MRAIVDRLGADAGRGDARRVRAHALQERLTPRQLASYHTGVLYQQLHALALVLLGVIAA